MESVQHRLLNRQLGAAVAAVVFTASVFAGFITSGGNLGISIQNYGFPLAFLRSYGARPLVSLTRAISSPSIYCQFFPRALAFDIFIAVIAVVASGVCAYAWAAAWSTRRCAGYLLAAISFGIVLAFGSWLPMPLGLFMLAGELFLILTWVYCIGYASWLCGKVLVGPRWAGWAPPLMAIGLAALGYSCRPYDIFRERNPADLPALVQYLSDANPQVRSLALSALGGRRSYDEATATAIIKAMSDPDRFVRVQAISLSSRLDSFSDRTMPILVEHFLRDGSCTSELTALGSKAKSAVPALKSKLAASTGYTKLGICQALRKIEGNTVDVVPALIELLSDDYGPIQRDAATQLGYIGADAADAVPRLTAMVNYVPKADQPPVVVKSQGVPTVRPMTEAEFYPQTRSAAKDALTLIQAAIRSSQK